MHLLFFSLVFEANEGRMHYCPNQSVSPCPLLQHTVGGCWRPLLAFHCCIEELHKLV